MLSGKTLIFVPGAIAVVAVAVVLSSTVFASQPPIVGPTPDATAMSELEAILDHYDGKLPEPIPTGDVHGFDFGQAPSPVCDPQMLYGRATDFGDTAMVPVELLFSVGSVPAGFEVQTQRPMSHPSTGPLSVISCRQEVFLVAAYWRSDSGGELAVRRRLGNPSVTLPVSGDRIGPLNVAGRQAIIVHQRHSAEEIHLLMRDQDTQWHITGSGVSEAEVIAFAEGLR